VPPAPPAADAEPVTLLELALLDVAVLAEPAPPPAPAVVEPCVPTSTRLSQEATAMTVAAARVCWATPESDMAPA
jgi:hypothetical protein